MYSVFPSNPSTPQSHCDRPGRGGGGARQSPAGTGARGDHRPCGTHRSRRMALRLGRSARAAVRARGSCGVPLSARLSAAASADVGGTARAALESRGTFGAAAQNAPRYMGIPTFMRSPLVSLDEACRCGLDVAMVGIPFDNGVTNRAGARHGPREVRVQSANMRGIHRVHQFSPFEIARVADVGDIALEHHYGLCACSPNAPRLSQWKPVASEPRPIHAAIVTDWLTGSWQLRART